MFYCHNSENALKKLFLESCAVRGIDEVKAKNVLPAQS